MKAAARVPGTEHPLHALQRSCGNAAAAGMIQRYICPDEAAKAERRKYQSITKVNWYKNLRTKEAREIAMRLHKDSRRYVTTAEADEIIRTGVDPGGDEDDGYSSDVEQEAVVLTDRLLTPEEFDDLPPVGTINPNRLRTAQGGIELHFRETQRGSVPTLADRIARDPSVANALPAVQIGVHQGRVWAFDTRRVVACQMARATNSDVLIKYEKISDKEKGERVSSIFTPRQWMGIVTTVRHDGTHGGSTPHINPAYASQLQHLYEAWDYGSADPFSGPLPPRPRRDPIAGPSSSNSNTPSSNSNSNTPSSSSGQITMTTPPISTSEPDEAFDENSIRAELNRQQLAFEDWAVGVADKEPTHEEAVHAQRVFAYMKKCFAAGLHESAPRGWVLTDVRAQCHGRPVWVQVHFLNSWRIPNKPGNAPAPLLPRVRGG